MKHEKLAETEPRLEEDIIVPTRRQVFEGGGMTMESIPNSQPELKRRRVAGMVAALNKIGAMPGTASAIRRGRSEALNSSERCTRCGITVSANKYYCCRCADELGVS